MDFLALPLFAWLIFSLRFLFDIGLLHALGGGMDRGLLYGVSVVVLSRRRRRRRRQI